MLKKFFFFLILILLMLCMCGNVNATELKTGLDIIKKESETKYLENDQGFISKTVVDSNSDTGEATIELKLSNTAKIVEQTTETELFLVVDNSPSMDFVTSSGKTRKKIVLDSASKLVDSIYNISSNIKIGLIDFHGWKGGIFGESASIYNATVRQKLTSDKDTIQTAISKLLSENTESGTNIDAGLKKAQQNFSKTAKNKIIVLLTDGIPNADTEGNEDKDDDVTKEISLTIQNNTKSTLQNLKSSGIYTITMLTGMSISDENTDKNGLVYSDNSTLEKELIAAENIFGTSENPTANKYYLVSSTDIDNVVTKDILNDVSSKIQNPINTVKIVDYFPKDIVDNFDFFYVESPSIGTQSNNIDTESKTITWDIGTLKGNEVATLKYKLKIKDMKNKDLLNKTIATNEKVVLTYKDKDLKDYTVELTSSPKIQLSEVKSTNITTKQDNEKNNTKSIMTLPHTGGNINIAIIGIIAITIIAVVLLKKYDNYKGIK